MPKIGTFSLIKSFQKTEVNKNNLKVIKYSQIKKINVEPFLKNFKKIDFQNF